MDLSFNFPLAGGSGSGLGSEDIVDLTMNDLVFAAFTEPQGPGSQMCLNFSIIDDQLVEPTERFTVCGLSSDTSVNILNNGCTDIKIIDNEGENVNYNNELRQILKLYTQCSDNFSTIS